MRTHAVIAAILAFLLVRCATVSQGPMQRIEVTSRPAGAAVKLSDCGVGSTDKATTPSVVFVNRRATECTLTFTHPEHGSRSVSLVRTRRAPSRTLSELESDAFEKGLSLAHAGATMLGMAGEIVAEAGPLGAIFAAPLAIAGAFAVAVPTVAGAAWGTGKGIDAMSGANYRQSPSAVVVDLMRPVPDVAGRYTLVSVNGNGLPATTWAASRGSCGISTNAGSLTLHANGRWIARFTEQESCGRKTRTPVDSDARGVFGFDGDRIILESESGIAVADVDGDQMTLTMGGGPAHPGQTATYSLRREATR